nr:MAG TPA: hypothetical protein [Caudoviricetes sp.]
MFGDICYAAKNIKLLSVTFVTMMSGIVLTVANLIGIIFLILGERLKSG